MKHYGIVAVGADIKVRISRSVAAAPVVMLTDDRFAAVRQAEDGECRVLLYQPPEETRSFAFTFASKRLVTVGFSQSGGLLAVTRDDTDSFAVEEVINGKTRPLYSIGEYVTRCVFMKNGSCAVGFLKTFKHESTPLLRIFSPDGEVLYEYFQPSAIYCAALTLDTDENVWFRPAPFGRLYRLREGKLACFDSEIAEISAFSVSKDGKSILACADDSDGRLGFEPRTYLLRQSGDRFGNAAETDAGNGMRIQCISCLQDNFVAWEPSYKEPYDRFAFGSVFERGQREI